METLASNRNRKFRAVSLHPRPAQTDLIGKDLVDHAMALAQEHQDASDHSSRRSIGQVFTPATVCRFVADGLGRIASTYSLLDPGAGTGSLTAAVCDRVMRQDTPTRLSAVLFETDSTVIQFLRRCMDQCKRTLESAGHQFDFSIRKDDFVLARAQRSLFDDGLGPKFDGVVMNPPYFKLAKDSVHARVMADIVHGQPNIYALFMAVGAEMLRPGGTIVAITPRSYCNGLYFREFRRWFFLQTALRRLHLFESRTATFTESQVLQESLITVATRRPDESLADPFIVVSTSNDGDFTEFREQKYPASAILDNSAGDLVVRVPTESTDAAIMDAVESWKTTFAGRGLRISTGPVVSFRAKQYLLAEKDGASAVPLLSVHNVRRFKTVWPLAKGNKPVAFRDCPSTKSQLLPSRNYVLLRRFSAKEEHRRLTASCYIPSAQERKHLVALENHINYVYACEGELSDAETIGLAAMFNSALLDRYFRILSGNTQVNATEIRTMPFPELKAISHIGKRIRELSDFKEDRVEQIVLDELKINEPISRKLLGTPT